MTNARTGVFLEHVTITPQDRHDRGSDEMWAMAVERLRVVYERQTSRSTSSVITVSIQSSR